MVAKGGSDDEVPKKVVRKKKSSGVDGDNTPLEHHDEQHDGDHGDLHNPPVRKRRVRRPAKAANIPAVPNEDHQAQDAADGQETHSHPEAAPEEVYEAEFIEGLLGPVRCPKCKQAFIKHCTRSRTCRWEKCVADAVLVDRSTGHWFVLPRP